METQLEDYTLHVFIGALGISAISHVKIIQMVKRVLHSIVVMSTPKVLGSHIHKQVLDQMLRKVPSSPERLLRL